MKDMLSEEQGEAILKALDDAIKNGPWDKSNFLRAIGKSLSDIRESFVNEMGAHQKDQVQAAAQLAQRRALRGDQQEVFVSLYSADGTNIQSWERIVANLPRQMISRPVYNNEEYVRALIKSKEHKQNEAYIAIYINQADVIPLPPEKTLSDKLGNPLLTLKDRALNLENIRRFIHVTGVYQYDRGHLIKEA